MLTRRQMVERSIFTAAALTTPGVFAEAMETASMAEGPFYPDKMPLDTDNDLLVINDSITPAVGEITHLSGRILSQAGEPIRNAFVEIWQVDNEGVYIHSDDNRKDRQDKNFQGYGRFLTDAKGHYYFRTVKPRPYPGRTPHIHVAVTIGGKRALTTQLLINGHPHNESDNLFRQIEDPLAKETLLVDFTPIKGSKVGELAANFEIRLGHTAEELDDGSIRGISKKQSGGRGR